MQKIVPFLWFNDNAEEAVQFYTSIFKDSGVDDVSRYSDTGPGPAGAAMVVEFRLEGQPFMALNGFNAEGSAPTAVNGAIALFVNCKTQAETDRLWERLSEGGEQLPCGWVRDKYGFSWNIVPEGLVDVISGGDPVRSQRAMQAMMQMQKLDIDELRRVYNA